ncbi:hypothetical protein PILCRDRAFT_454215 [Piloderma croceum F 1598]|uniref:BTB domain-containing protein n=1 Tax=Piloderma croceum (strain F 1598) TaxID=765440 RepID=A0A0C3BZB2_PILCF|nr:hypothetical protein PILCRDRAFT_454215 [Piloderma croceum F 1598]
MVDGCPVVQLSDTAVDVQLVLNALYENRSYNFNDPKPGPLSVVAAFLRLGKKYEIDSLRAEAECRLAAHFPSSLKDWDRSLSAIGPSLIQYYRGLEFDVANLARDQNLLSILPAALYSCSLLGMREILRGISIGSGKVVSLSSYDRDVCLLGRDRLISE